MNKELIREAARDEKTLIGLENKLREADLEASKKQDPWELITKPTLLQNPVAPSRRVIGLQSLILGLIIGSALAIFREKKLGIIYDEEVLKKLIPINIISKIKLKEIQEKDKTFLFLRDYLEKKSTSSISFLTLDGIKSKELKSFTNGFKKNKVALYDNVSAIDLIPNQNSKYIIIKLGFTKISEIINLKNYIELLNSQFQGIIIIQENDDANSINSIDIKIKSKARYIYITISDLILNSNSLKTLNKNIFLRSKFVYDYFYNLVSKFLKK